MTQQISDAILIEGDPFSLRFGLPFSAQHPMILDRDQVVSIPRPCPRPRSHACRRGYVAGWTITAGRVHLARLQGRYELKSEEPLFAEWASTVTQLALGNINPALGNPYEPEFEAYLEIEIVEGIAVRWRVIKGRELSARRVKGPPWQEGFNWPALLRLPARDRRLAQDFPQDHWRGLFHHGLQEYHRAEPVNDFQDSALQKLKPQIQ